MGPVLSLRRGRMTGTTLILSSIHIILLFRLLFVLIFTTISHESFDADEFRDHIFPIYRISDGIWLNMRSMIVCLDGGLSMWEACLVRSKYKPPTPE